jgi:hypothetical protein
VEVSSGEYLAYEQRDAVRVCVLHAVVRGLQGLRLSGVSDDAAVPKECFAAATSMQEKLNWVANNQRDGW